MTTFFTSDHHFGHAKIIGYCNRPFQTLTEMDKIMIERWNSVVGPHDHVYHLGDFAFGHYQEVERYRHALHGRITLVRGNHDHLNETQLRRIFDEVVDDMTIHGKRDGVLYLRHHPTTDHPADIVLSGHVHDRWRVNGKNINVGVDQWDYYPRTLQELVKGATT